MIKKMLNYISHFIDFNIDRRSKHKRFTPFIELELSSICNAHCIFCPYDAKLKVQNTVIMEEDTFLKVLERIRNGNDKQVNFTPTTGESLTHPRWDEYIDRVLNIPNIEKVVIYSNAILLNDRNQDKLIGLLLNDEIKKIKEIYFSLGGWDRETYKLMFGVDKFDTVSKNITAFLKRAKDLGMEVRVYLNFRLPKYKTPNRRAAIKIYNQYGYKYVKLQFTNTLAYIYGEKNKNLQYCEVPFETTVMKEKHPCLLLYKTRYAANGSVWADGCVISELPNDTSLKLGSLDDSVERIEEARRKLINNWKLDKNIPLPCKRCIFYEPELNN